MKDEEPISSRTISASPVENIITWNMQGAGSNLEKSQRLRKYMRNDNVTAICLQECGNLFEWRSSAALDYDWKVAIYKQWNAGGGNDRCSLAILVRDDAIETKSRDATDKSARPMIGALLAQGFWLWTIHAPASRNSRAYVVSACLTANRQSGDLPWMLAGDFNLIPEDAYTIQGSKVWRSHQPTHESGREIDYSFVSTNVNIITNAYREEPLLSDHYPLRFWVNYRRANRPRRT